MNSSVVVRLTLFYLAVIMAMSIGFSLVIYNISSNELRRGGRPPGTFTVDSPLWDSFETARQRQFEDSRRHLQGNLILLNLGTALVGAVVSYGLARKSLQPIEEAFEAQGRFTADASHELRTPLTAMQSSIEVGLRNPKLTLRDSKLLLQSMLDEVRKLSSLSNGLLKLTRADSKDMPRQPVDLAVVAAEAIDQLRLAADHKHLTLALEPVASEVVVSGDAVSLKEAVTILLDNAIKYSPKEKTITISARQQGKYGQLAVCDQGPGIKATDLTHIFERFYRADVARSRDRVEGYGLGLSIAQKIAVAHAGSLDVKSQIGEGSVFTLKVPLVEKTA